MRSYVWVVESAQFSNHQGMCGAEADEMDAPAEAGTAEDLSDVFELRGSATKHVKDRIPGFRGWDDEGRNAPTETAHDERAMGTPPTVPRKSLDGAPSRSAPPTPKTAKRLKEKVNHPSAHAGGVLSLMVFYLMPYCNNCVYNLLLGV